MIMTVTLARGAQLMARQKVIVKRLEAVENLGNMDVMCCDKTGTLTRGAVTLQRHVDPWGSESERVLRWACINSALEMGVRSPLDAAILEHNHPDIESYTKRAELPLDFQRRRVSVLAERHDGVDIITKGAPEGILPLCTRMEHNGTVVPLDIDSRAEADRTFQRLSRAGLHLLAIAWKAVPPEQITLSADDERDLVLSGFAAFLDPPDPSARETLTALRDAGVALKILTGDGELVTRTICHQVGIRARRVVLGHTIDQMTDDALAGVVEKTSIFARVTPARKTASSRSSVTTMWSGIWGTRLMMPHHSMQLMWASRFQVVLTSRARPLTSSLLEKSLGAVHRGIIGARVSATSPSTC